MKNSITCRTMITRAQYEEAVCKLPPILKHAGEELSVEVDVRSGLEAGGPEGLMFDKPLPMKVTFIKHLLSGERLGWSPQTVLVWKLSPFFNILWEGPEAMKLSER